MLVTLGNSVSLRLIVILILVFYFIEKNEIKYIKTIKTKMRASKINRNLNNFVL